MLRLKLISCDNLESDPLFAALCQENAEESHIEGMPPISVQAELYRQLERSGSFFVIGAYYEDILIGFLTIIATVLPHYGTVTAMSESFFVSKTYRKTGAGLKLLEFGERFARELGSPGFFCSAPANGSLSKVLPRRGYRETNRVFFKRFANE